MSAPYRPPGLTTAHLRKGITPVVKVQVILNQGGRCAASGEVLTDARKVRFDHRPPLQDRPWNPDADDFDPPQNDPAYIEAIATEEHDRRTFGPGGEKRITTRGSDLREAARTRALTEAEASFRARLLAKHSAAGDPAPRPKPKRRIPSRPFPKAHRPLRRRAPTS